MVSARRKKPSEVASAPSPSKFSIEHFESIARDLDSGRLKLDKIVISDDVQIGLRAIIRKSGTITYHVSYAAGESRPYLKVGQYPDTSIAEARELARTITTLADHGIDVQSGLHDRLIKELREKGTKWRP